MLVEERLGDLIMLPSTRTPDGEPVDCPVCGTRSVVLISQPPGDAVCPICGGHVWAIFEDQGTQHLKVMIRDFITELTRLVHSNAPAAETSQFLVNGLKHTLAAYGAIFWTTRRQILRPWQRTPKMKCYAGMSDTDTFAAEVILGAHQMLKRVVLPDHALIQIGVPLFDGGRAAGAIQVLQRDTQSDGARKGYLRFLSEIGQIVSPLVSRS